MEANPWALIVFLITAYVLFQGDVLTVTQTALFFIGFVILWLAAGYFYDFLRYRKLHNHQRHAEIPTSHPRRG